MAIVKFVTSDCPMNNIFPYVIRKEATEQRLIGGIECSPDTALEEFRYVKQKYGKEDGRTYYHIVQSFAPDDELTPETAHEIGLRFAEHFPGYQILVATHFNTGHIHNHLIMNSVNYQNGKKFHQTRDELIQVKVYSNKLCQQYGLSVIEEKCSYGRWPEWKKLLRRFALYAISNSDTKEEFIACMCEHGYKVRWEDKYKYITFTTPDNHVCRDKSLFDECLLKGNLEVYFALGGASSKLYDDYNDYKTLCPCDFYQSLLFFLFSCSLIFCNPKVVRSKPRVDVSIPELLFLGCVLMGGRIPLSTDATIFFASSDI